MSEAARSVFDQTVVMFIIVVIGAVCYKLKILDDTGKKQLSDLVLYIVNPLLIFLSYQTEMRSELIEGFLWTALMAAVTFTAFILLSHLFFRNRNGRDPAVERFSSVYSNCGFMGTPLIFGVFGSDGVFIMNGFFTVFNLFVWTHGIISMSRGRTGDGGEDVWRSLLKALRAPALIAVFAGLVCFFCGIRLPEIIHTAFSNVADMTTPLAMIAAGASIMSAGVLKSIRNPKVYIVSAVRLVLLPLIGFAIIAFLPCTETVKLITLIEISCPCAAIGTMFAIKYDHDPDLASQVFAVSTLLSAVTMPLIVSSGTGILEVLGQI